MSKPQPLEIIKRTTIEVVLSFSPIHIKTRNEFLALINSYKEKLIPHLPPIKITETQTLSTTTSIFSLPKVKKTHIVTKTSTVPPTKATKIGSTAENLSVYTLFQLWSAIVKHEKRQRKKKLSLSKRRVKGGLDTLREIDVGGVLISPMRSSSRLGAKVRVTKQKIVQWIMIDKEVKEGLNKNENREYRALCKILVATDGGRKLDVDSQGASGQSDDLSFAKQNEARLQTTSDELVTFMIELNSSQVPLTVSTNTDSYYDRSTDISNSDCSIYINSVTQHTKSSEVLQPPCVNNQQKKPLRNKPNLEINIPAKSPLLNGNPGTGFAFSDVNFRTHAGSTSNDAIYAYEMELRRSGKLGKL